MKGDRVEIVVDAGEGTRTYEVSATRAGRRVEVSTGRGIVEVTEVTRNRHDRADGEVHGQPGDRPRRATPEIRPSSD